MRSGRHLLWWVREREHVLRETCRLEFVQLDDHFRARAVRANDLHRLIPFLGCRNSQMDLELLHHWVEAIDEDANELFFRHRLFEEHKFSLACLDVCDEALQIRAALLHSGPIDL